MTGPAFVGVYSASAGWLVAVRDDVPNPTRFEQQIRHVLVPMPWGQDIIELAPTCYFKAACGRPVPAPDDVPYDLLADYKTYTDKPLETRPVRAGQTRLGEKQDGP